MSERVVVTATILIKNDACSAIMLSISLFPVMARVCRRSTVLPAVKFHVLWEPFGVRPPGG